MPGLSLARLAAVWLFVVLSLVALHVVVPQRSGPLALTAVFEPYVVVSGLIAAPFALIRPTRNRAALLAILLVVIVGRYVPGWVSLPASGPPRLTVATWNVFGGPNGAQRTVEGLLGIEAD